MKCQVPQIVWHSRDPVLSIDFQPIQNDVLRLASGGTDSHVLIWYVTYQENKSIKLECASDLYRHNKAVNAVRFSPKGDLLVSGDDDGDMFVWELKEREQMIDPPNDDENLNKEDWYPIKSLRGHLDDIYDISWSKDGNFLVSSSMDNTVVLWDMQKYNKLHIFSDFKGNVQGVCLDPLNRYIASIGIDRTLRIHDINSKKTACKISKAPWTNSTEKGTFKARLFYDDTLQSFFRRLTFTPDGELLIVPSGIVEKGEKINNTCYIFSRHALNKPVISLPTGDKYTVAVRCNPFLYKLRESRDSSDKENEPMKPLISLPYRMIFAVAASDSVLLYDTEQLLPFAYVSNIHYTHLTDLSWSPDGLTLVCSSSDGYCSFILFTREELGEIYVPEKPKESASDKSPQTNENKNMDTTEPVTPSCKTDVDMKQSNPVTPKRITPIPVESPKISTHSKDENLTPTSKSNKISSEKKSGKKSPKMPSIKQFFISPKTVPSNSTSSDSKTPTNSMNENKNNKIGCHEIIDISESPLKDEKTKSKGIDNLLKENASKISEKIEPMDISDNPTNLVKQISDSTDVKKQSKCKVRLEFADKDHLMANIDDNASDSNSLSCGAILDDRNEPKQLQSNENDWKLELSQDDDNIPMEITPSQKETKPAVSENLNSNNLFKAAESAVDIKKSETKQTATKRRISFVTLSTKPTFKK